MLRTFAGTHETDSPAAENDALVAAAVGDPDAFGALYYRHLSAVYRYLRTRCESEDEAADLTQTVFERAFHALPSYRPGRAPLTAWLLRIARNAATDAHRRRSVAVPFEFLPVEPEHGGPSPEALALQRDRLAELRRLLATIEPRKRELLALRYGAGLSSTEIAAVLGKSPAAVKKQLTRTLAQLKEHYDVQPD